MLKAAKAQSWGKFEQWNWNSEVAHAQLKKIKTRLTFSVALIFSFRVSATSSAHSMSLLSQATCNHFLPANVSIFV